MSLLLALACLAAAAPAHADTQGPPPAAGTEVLAYALTVRDLERSVAFFARTADAVRLADSVLEGTALRERFGIERGRVQIATLAIGAERVQLYAWGRPHLQQGPRPPRGDDRWFQHVAIVVSDMPAAVARALAAGARPISAGAQRIPDWNPAAGGIEAFYFRDPDGHPLEFLRFPAGKGDPRWQSRERLILGIDHSALTIRDTDTSERFYADSVGLAVRGRSLNYGREQEQLSGVAGAIVRITGVGGASGPGVEFLDYRCPPRPHTRPVRLAAWQLQHWHVVIRTTATTRERLLHDPDGHALLVIPATP